MYNCNISSSVYVWPDSLKRHLKFKHSMQKSERQQKQQEQQQQQQPESLPVSEQQRLQQQQMPLPVLQLQEQQMPLPVLQQQQQDFVFNIYLLSTCQGQPFRKRHIL